MIARKSWPAFTRAERREREAQISSREPEWAAGKRASRWRRSVGRREGTPFRLQSSCTNACNG
eukprot:6207349-Pleurochrysis_carterae.AAC.1